MKIKNLKFNEIHLVGGGDDESCDQCSGSLWLHEVPAPCWNVPECDGSQAAKNYHTAMLVGVGGLTLSVLGCVVGISLEALRLRAQGSSYQPMV